MVITSEPIRSLRKRHDLTKRKKKSNDEMFTQIPVGRVLLSFDQYLLLFLF